MIRGRLDVDVLAFDVFGTLFDHDSAVDKVKGEVGESADEIARIWRFKQLQYSWLRTLMHRPADFASVTRDGLDYALAATGTESRHAETMMATYRRLAPFTEVKDALDGLRAEGRRLVVLSNGSRAMLESVIAENGLGGRFETMLSAEDANVFKPHPLVYQLAVDRLGMPKERICLVSSNSWDAVGGAAFGFKAVWVNRKDEPTERLPAEVDAQIPDLSALADQLA